MRVDALPVRGRAATGFPHRLRCRRAGDPGRGPDVAAANATATFRPDVTADRRASVARLDVPADLPLGPLGRLDFF
jgi:hypothetical protein